MKLDLKKFEGTLPYASELFGIYQPLIGWRSKLSKDRMMQGYSPYRDLTEQAVSQLVSPRLAERVPREVGDAILVRLPEVGGAHMLPRVALEVDSVLARWAVSTLTPDKPPSGADWTKLFGATDEEAMKILYNIANVIDFRTPNGPFKDQVLRDSLVYVTQAITAAKARGISEPAAEVQLVQRESALLGYFRWLAAKRADVLTELFFRRMDDPVVSVEKYTDPLDGIGKNDLLPVLSPVGIVHLFRQYFFEFDSFLGPPVGHAWLAPGTTLELVEETVRRTSTERTTEIGQENIDKAEVEDKESDELSTSVKDENKTDLRFGFSANVRYSNGTLEAGANTDLSIDRARSTSRETVNKHMRQQSHRASSEIRRSFKSTVKTTTETTQTSGRRYVIQNKLDKVVNYELRRKMRQVGVQVQDIGTQLCWQVFVDDPGENLGLAQLVHIAAPPDLSGLAPPPPLPDIPTKSAQVPIQFAYERAADSEGDGEYNVTYYNGDDREYGWWEKNDKVVYQREYPVEVPPGYTLLNQFNVTSQHNGTLVARVDKKSETTILVTLEQVNFEDQRTVNLDVTLHFGPDPKYLGDLEAARKEALKSYTDEVQKREKEAFIAAARERIKLASEIDKRLFDDLRQEERVMIYRRLIGQLMEVGKSQGLDPHVTSEVIRAIFDVDKMLYFVAPEWWKPRNRPAKQVISPSQSNVVGEAQIVQWGDQKERNRDNNYFVTDESAPQPMGASLGWLLQLDGDNLRNAFLNAPWVKAVIPIRPGKEQAALNWLELGHLAGTEGLDEEYKAPPAELKVIRDALGLGATEKVTLRHALRYLALQIADSNRKADSADPATGSIPTEKVYEKGFYPLVGGFVASAAHTNVFSQWVEVLPTDQIVAVDYDASAHM